MNKSLWFTLWDDLMVFCCTASLPPRHLCPWFFWAEYFTQQLLSDTVVMQITVCGTAPVAQHILQRFSFFLFSLQICMEAAQSVASVSKSCPREQGSYSTVLTEAYSISRGFSWTLYSFLLTATHQSRVLRCDSPHCCSLIATSPAGDCHV